jgi:hypothetical protein
MFIWDYILTFGMEVELVWKSEWNFMKGLYLFQRYLPFIDTVWLGSYRQTGTNLTEDTCLKLGYSGVSVVVGIAASEMILTLRTWTVWDRNKRLGIILLIIFNLAWISSLVIIVRFNNSLTYGAPPYPGFNGCFLTYANQDVVYTWVILLIWDALLLMLMLVPAFRAYRHGGNSTLIKLVYGEGIVYYLYLFALSCINVIVFKTLPLQYQLLLTPVERVVHSMLTSHVLLHIRAQARGNADD